VPRVAGKPLIGIERVLLIYISPMSRVFTVASSSACRWQNARAGAAPVPTGVTSFLSVSHT
jgi:hypothetical protein